MKKRLLAFIIGIALLAGSAPAYAAAEEGIAVVVNDSIVTVTDVEDRTNLYLSGAAQKPTPEERKKVEQQVLNKLIDEALQLQEAKKLNITVDEGQINAGFAFVAKQNNLSPEEFKTRLKDSGVNIDSLYAQIKSEIAWNQVISRKLRPEINISEGEIDMTMDQLAHVKGKKQYHVAEIFLNVPSAAQDNDIHAKATDLAKQITEGATFSSIARQYSQAPGADGGGDIGWVEEGQLDQPLDQALATLQPGQITPPIKSGNGYHILFLRDLRRSAGDISAPADTSPAAATGPVVLLKQILIPVKPNDPPGVIKAKLERGIALKKEIKSCDALDKRMKDFPSKGTGTLGKGPQNSMPDPLRGIVEKLAVNELSAPIHAPEGWAMLMVCSRDEAAPPPPAATDTSSSLPTLGLDKNNEAARENVADKIGAQRLSKLAEHYLLDLRAAAFIDKRI